MCNQTRHQVPLGACRTNLEFAAEATARQPEPGRLPCRANHNYANSFLIARSDTPLAVASEPVSGAHELLPTEVFYEARTNPAFRGCVARSFECDLFSRLPLTSAATSIALPAMIPTTSVGDNCAAELVEDSVDLHRLVKYKRGQPLQSSGWDMVYPAKLAAADAGTSYGTSKINTLTNYGDASLPQPKFIKQRQFGSGGMISAYQGNLTIGRALLFGQREFCANVNRVSGYRHHGGQQHQDLNNEITESDIGMMISGTGCSDSGQLRPRFACGGGCPAGVDPNLVGGAEGIFVNASNNEVAYNTSSTAAITRSGPAEIATVAQPRWPCRRVGVRGWPQDHHNFGLQQLWLLRGVEHGRAGGVGAGSRTRAPLRQGTFSNSTFLDNGHIDRVDIASPG